MKDSKYNFTVDWFSKNIPEFVKYLDQYRNIGNFLEIGSYEGRSAIWMLENIQPKKLTCIDPGVTIGNQILKKNLKSFNNVKLIEKPSHEAYKDIIFDKFDFIYIDGAHITRDCYLDIIVCWHLLKIGGILSIDDYGRSQSAPDGSFIKDAVNLFFNNCYNSIILHKKYQFWVTKT